MQKVNALSNFRSTFGTLHPIIGMIHLAGKEDELVVSRALAELQLFEEMGVQAAIIENYHGSLRQVELVLKAAQFKFKNLALGVNVLPNEFQYAFVLARKYGAKFIQLDFVSGTYYNGEHPPIQLELAEYEKYRRAFSDILVLGGVHPKYYFPVLGSNLRSDIEDAMNRADAIVVTGEGTGLATPTEKILAFRQWIGSDFPLVIGAGLTAENAATQLSLGNGAIVGSYIKRGNTKNEISRHRLFEILRIARSGTQRD